MFVVFEGIEGSGKSSVLKKVANGLRSRGHTVLCTREPGGTPLSEKIRPILLSTKMDPWAEVFFYQALRAEHVAHAIIPALKKRTIVLCDRYMYSTLAYQGAARGLSWKVLNTLNALATRGVEPDLVFWLDLPARLGLDRAKDPNRFEAEGVSFQERARRGFGRAMRESNARWIKLDSKKKTQEQLTTQVLDEILGRSRARG